MKNYWPALAFALTLAFIVLFSKPIYLVATTDPPPEYMVKNLEEQMGCAERLGFTVRRPILRVMKKPPGWNEIQGWAHDVWPNSLIILAPYGSYQTMAHELGHVIDFQTDRKGHPDFEVIKYATMEGFADVIRDKILAECQKPANRP